MHANSCVQMQRGNFNDIWKIIIILVIEIANADPVCKTIKKSFFFKRELYAYAILFNIYGNMYMDSDTYCYLYVYMQIQNLYLNNVFRQISYNTRHANLFTLNKKKDHIRIPARNSIQYILYSSIQYMIFVAIISLKIFHIFTFGILYICHRIFTISLKRPKH